MANSWQHALDKQHQFVQNKHFVSECDKSLPGPGQETLYAEVGEPSMLGGTRANFTSFGSYRSEPAPYATTTLAMNNKMRTLVSEQCAVNTCQV